MRVVHTFLIFGLIGAYALFIYMFKSQDLFWFEPIIFGVLSMYFVSSALEKNVMTKSRTMKNSIGKGIFVALITIVAGCISGCFFFYAISTINHIFSIQLLGAGYSYTTPISGAKTLLFSLFWVPVIAFIPATLLGGTYGYIYFKKNGT